MDLQRGQQLEKNHPKVGCIIDHWAPALTVWDGISEYPERLASRAALNCSGVLTSGSDTDSVGSDEYNLKLSQRRADAVRDYLTSNAINPSVVQAIGLGKADPVASNDNNAGRQQNRRVEMVVSGDVIGQPIQAARSSLQ